MALPQYNEHYYQQHAVDDQQFALRPRQVYTDDLQLPLSQGHGVVRSRSDETLYHDVSPPLAPSQHQRRASTLRRRRKKTTAAATTNDLIIDFNDGKEIDLDKLTVGADSYGPLVGQRTLDKLATGAGSYDQKTERLSNSWGETKVSAAHANICNWLRTQNVSGGENVTPAVSTLTGYHQSLDVHHL